MSRMRGKGYRPSINSRHTGWSPTDRDPAPASNILDHSYSPETEQLTVTFRGGRRYRYLGVSKEIAAGLEAAQSKGQFVHKEVIDKFDYEKLGLDD